MHGVRKAEGMLVTTVKFRFDHSIFGLVGISMIKCEYRLRTDVGFVLLLIPYMRTTTSNSQQNVACRHLEVLHLARKLGKIECAFCHTKEPAQ